MCACVKVPAYIIVSDKSVMVLSLFVEMENVVGGEDAFQERVMKVLSPCLSQLVVITREESSSKMLNNLILLKTKNPSPKASPLNRFRFLAITTLLCHTSMLKDMRFKNFYW